MNVWDPAAYLNLNTKETNNNRKTREISTYSLVISAIWYRFKGYVNQYYIWNYISLFYYHIEYYLSLCQNFILFSCYLSFQTEVCWMILGMFLKRQQTLWGESLLFYHIYGENKYKGLRFGNNWIFAHTIVIRICRNHFWQLSMFFKRLSYFVTAIFKREKSYFSLLLLPGLLPFVLLLLSFFLN